jgi:mannitol/fructose-specific phosphotransferase system IIA component (Ntr-type)
MTLLASSFGPDSLAIVETLADRTEAIRLSGQLLERSGRVGPEYVSSMLDAVEKFGPYIVIAPGIALAHGKSEDGVLQTGLSLLVIREPIVFGHELNDPVSLVVGLAARDHDSHIELMGELAEFLGDEAKVNSLLQVSDLSQLRNLLG